MKKLLAVLLAVMMVFCLAACGDKDEEEDESGEELCQAIDITNARLLKNIGVMNYLCWEGPFASQTGTITVYLTKDGQDITTSESEAMSYSSEKYGEDTKIAAEVTVEGEFTVNCDGIDENVGKKIADGSEAEYQKFDEANINLLKTSIINAYLISDYDEFDRSATYYLSSDNQELITSTSGAMKYTSKEYKDYGYISGTCDENGVVTINCEGIS